MSPREYDESDARIRPSRTTRRRTKDRPSHSDSITAFVTTVDRGRTTCVTDDGVVITAMKARTGADFRVTFGKYVGKALKDVPDSYVQWLKSQDNPMDLAKRLIIEWKRMKGGDA